MKTIQGDLIQLAVQGKFNIIVHGCNCFNTMGSGIAKQVKNVFPTAYEVDQLTIKGGRSKLGTYTYSKHKIKALETDLTIINAYTQFNYLPRNVVNADYDAIENIFKDLYEEFADEGNHIAYPKIGAGLAGGNWNTISSIIDKQLKDMEHTYVEYKK